MNKTISRYIERNIYNLSSMEDFPNEDLEIIVVIPCFNEDKILASIRSLIACDRPHFSVEVIVSINAGVDTSIEVKNQNKKTFEELANLSDIPDWIKVMRLINNDLPAKKAGVGLGRKIGMDLAVMRFLSIDKVDGIIVCFDADSLCQPNYFKEIKTHFADKNVQSASIFYAHPIDDESVNAAAIIQYELHLRYFIQMQKWASLPYAYHTVGSSMACTVLAYCSVGGMNQRKAGEDFYFIHKLIKYGSHSELNSTTVIPSGRVSDRVPFGTGKAVNDLMMTDQIYMTYDPNAFYLFKKLVESLRLMYDTQDFLSYLEEPMIGFMLTVDIEAKWNELKKNTKDFKSFNKRFWQFFDAFQLMKYLHYAREKHFPDIPIIDAARSVFGFQDQGSISILKNVREADKNNQMIVLK